MALSEALKATMADSMLHWDVVQDPEVSLRTRIRSRRVTDIRIAEISGGPCHGQRGERHRDDDMGDYVGITCKLSGQEVCSGASGEMILHEGDIVIWRNRGDLAFRVDDWSRQFILLVPATRFEAALRKPLNHDRVHLPGRSALGALTPKFMAALCENFDDLRDREAEIAIEMALDLVGLSLDGIGEEESSSRTTLYDRILRYIDRRLEDSQLTPGEIADAHGISRRYLHLIFAQHGQTVSGWIRERRLLHCRDELERMGRKLSMTEIAHRYGYCDSAHFSRSFKQRFGVPPRQWRERLGHLQ